MKLKKNKIKYGQDFCCGNIGIPAGIDFKVKKFGGNMFKLRGKGYGLLPNNYGNGALYAYGLTPRQRKRFEEACENE